MDEHEAKEKLEKMEKNLEEIENSCGEIIEHLKNGLCINDEGLCVGELGSKKETIHDKKENELSDVIEGVISAINAMPN